MSKSIILMNGLIRAVHAGDEKQVWKLVASFIRTKECASYDLCVYLITCNRVDILQHLQCTFMNSSAVGHIVHTSTMYGSGDIVFGWLCNNAQPLRLLWGCMGRIHGVPYVERNLDWFIHMCGNEVMIALKVYRMQDMLLMQRGFSVCC